MPRIAISLLLLIALPAVAFYALDNPLHARVGAVTLACLVLWLSEVIPPYATTIVLWVATALLLGPLDSKFSLPSVLGWAASPILALFFGGFALGVSGEKYGIDRLIANWLIRYSRGKRLVLLLNVMAGTAVLSMWMSNIAAVAMMLVALGTLLNQLPPEDSFRKALLLGVAFGGDFGGIGTPIGTGPNGIALASVAKFHSISFLDWMVFAVPLTFLMVGLAFIILVMLYSVSGKFETSEAPALPPGRGRTAVILLFSCAVVAWLSEPLHRIPAPVVALIVSVVLFSTRLLDVSDLARIDWSTMILIAGGLTLGELLDRSGFAGYLASKMAWDQLQPSTFLLIFVSIAAFLSAIASNTAAAALLIPLGMSIQPSVPFAIMVAMGTSMGVPFVISTPPNAMAYGRGGLKARDILIPGLLLMLAGCLIVAFTGPSILNWLLSGTPHPRMQK